MSQSIETIEIDLKEKKILIKYVHPIDDEGTDSMLQSYKDNKDLLFTIAHAIDIKNLSDINDEYIDTISA